MADASAWEAVYLLTWSAFLGAGAAVLALFLWTRVSLQATLLLVVPVAAIGFVFGIGSLFLVMQVRHSFTNWQLKYERHAFVTHPVYVAACGGNSSALTSALTPQVIGGRSLDLLRVFKECLADPKAVNHSRSSSEFEPIRPKPEPPPLKLVLAGREDVFMPLMRALHSRELIGKSVWRTPYGGGEYCLVLEMIHKANDVELVSALAGEGLPLDCKGAARVWWVGITTQPERPTQTIKWLQALQAHGVDLTAIAPPVYPDSASPRNVLVDTMRCAAPAVLEALIRAGNDPEARSPTDSSMPATPKETWYRRRTNKNPQGCQTGREALGTDVGAIVRVDALTGVDLPPPPQALPPKRQEEPPVPKFRPLP